MSRRRWLNWFVKFSALLITFILGLPLLVMLIVPAFRREKEFWLKVGQLDDFRLNEPTPVTLTYQRSDGWVIRTVRKTVYVVMKPDGKPKVFSNICTHANCAVRWEKDKQAFFCPCHDGYFDIDGKVKAGPPPHPLDKFPSKIEGGFLFVRLQGS